MSYNYQRSLLTNICLMQGSVQTQEEYSLLCTSAVTTSDYYHFTFNSFKINVSPVTTTFFLLAMIHRSLNHSCHRFKPPTTCVREIVYSRFSAADCCLLLFRVSQETWMHYTAIYWSGRHTSTAVFGNLRWSILPFHDL